MFNFNSPIRRRRKKLRDLVKSDVSIFDTEQSRVIARGRLVYVPVDSVLHTHKNAGYYVGKIQIPIRSLRDYSNNKITVDLSYLVRETA